MNISEQSAISLMSTIIPACMAIIGIFIGDLVGKNTESRKNKAGVKNTYLGALQLTIYDVVRRIQDLKEKTFQEQLRCISDVKTIMQKADTWFYYDGNFLCSSVYLIASLIAKVQYVKDNLPVMWISKSEYEAIISHIRNIEILLRKIGGLWIIIQYDISSSMNPQNDCKLVSFSKFCSIIREERGNVIYRKLIDAIINIDEYSEELVALERELNKFYGTLTALTRIGKDPLYRERGTLIQ